MQGVYKPYKEWSLDEVRTGIARFIKEVGRMPTTNEIDTVDYLPASRTIQRKFGGLVQLRGQLGYEVVDLARGDARRATMTISSAQAAILEQEVESMLINRFGEVFVHSQKRYGVGGNRLDVYVYTPDGNFGVDVFMAKTTNSLMSNLRHKLKTYADFKETLYLVYKGAEPGYSMREPIPGNVVLMSADSFGKRVKKYKPYTFNRLVHSFTC